MIKVEFIRDFKSCYRKGDTRDVQPHFAKALIESGFAKAIERPERNKMIGEPIKEKRDAISNG